MTEADRPASGAPLLTADEWQSLKSICTPGGGSANSGGSGGTGGGKSSGSSGEKI